MKDGYARACDTNSKRFTAQGALPELNNSRRAPGRSEVGLRRAYRGALRRRSRDAPPETDSQQKQKQPANHEHTAGTKPWKVALPTPGTQAH